MNCANPLINFIIFIDSWIFIIIGHYKKNKLVMIIGWLLLFGMNYMILEII